MAALGTLLSSLTRRARLRRNETLWRQALEASRGGASAKEQHSLIEDLHRYTLARLVAMEFVPTRTLWMAGVFAVVGAFYLAWAGWVLAQAVAEDPEMPLARHVADLNREVDGAALLLLPLLLLLFGVTWLLGAVSARHSVAGSVLKGRYPAPVWQGPVFSRDALLLVLALTAGSLAAGVLGGLLGWLRQQSSPTALETVPAWLSGGALLVASVAFSVVSILVMHADGPLRRSAPDLSSATASRHAQRSSRLARGGGRYVNVFGPSQHDHHAAPGPPGHQEDRPGWAATLLVGTLVAAWAWRRR